MSNGTLIEIKGVSKYYNGKVCALDNIDLSVKKGEWLSIMGPSGSGKTTLLNIVSCLDRPSTGLVIVDGADIGRFDRTELARFRRADGGLIFQPLSLVSY